ncbi:MAG: alpha/beta hydrolase [Lachnospiraceae bacterium]|nr:alpha/beta hydrolase [Lachnospiraceae bacterium]
MPQDPRFMNRLIPSDETVAEGMKTLYADRSESYGVRYAHDVVYAHRSGVDLHLQMLYPGLLFPNIPSGLFRREIEEMMKKMPNRPQRPPMPDPSELPESKYIPIPDVSGKTQKRFPCVIFIKGSGWGKQNCYVELPMFIDIARAGFVVAAVEYRPASLEPFPGFVSDVKAAIRFLRANCDDFDIDPNRIAILGDSSGGHTSLMIGSTGWMRDYDDGDYPDVSSEVQACVAWYGVSDFSRFTQEGEKDYRPFLLPMIMGKEAAARPDAVDLISPISYIREENEYPPFLLMHGDRDVTVPFEQSVIMYNKLRECGKHVEFYKVQGANHGQYFWTKEVIQATIDFLRAYV